MLGLRYRGVWGYSPRKILESEVQNNVISCVLNLVFIGWCANVFAYVKKCSVKLLFKG